MEPAAITGLRRPLTSSMDAEPFGGTFIFSVCREPLSWVVFERFRSAAGDSSPPEGIPARSGFPIRERHTRSTCLSGLIHKHIRSANVTCPPFQSPELQDLQRAQAGHGLPDKLISLWRCLSKRGDLAASTILLSELCGEVSFVQRRAALPEFGGSRQPLDRQVRYYSE